MEGHASALRRIHGLDDASFLEINEVIDYMSGSSALMRGLML